jgi:hypothetical protein
MEPQGALITAAEAEEVIQIKTGPLSVLRTPMLILLGAAIVAILTLLILLALSLRGSRTGIEAAVPFLDKKAVETLQTP